MLEDRAELQLITADKLMHYLNVLTC